MESKRPTKTDAVAAAAHNARWGLVLFFIYVVLYSGFVALAAFFPERMAEPTPIGSVNLAVVYGIGLIVAALALAAVYLFAARSTDPSR
jgi:uncharacterized membrane protein (DUF485 family)